MKTASFFAPGFDEQVEQQNLEQQRRMAQALLEQSQQEMPSGQMVGNHYVPMAPTQGLAKILKAYYGRQGIESASEKQRALAEAVRGRNTQEMGQFTDMLMGSPARPTGQTYETGANEMGDESAQVPQYQGAVAGNPKAAYAYALGAQNPMLRQTGMQAMADMPKLEAAQLDRQENRAFRSSEAEANRQSRIDQLQMQHQQRLESMASQNANAQQIAEANRQHQISMAKLTASMKPEQLVPVLTPGSSQPVLLPRSQAVGQTPWNPAYAKTQQQEEAKAEGKKQLNDVLSDLKASYDGLKQGGGVTSTETGIGTNAAARLGNTGVGRLAGSVFGTENNSQREKIDALRPVLLASIKNATGMSAQQMNSNVELMLFLKAATDPAAGYEANIEAIKRLDRMYGLGDLFPKDEKTTTPNQPAMPSGFRVVR